MVHSEINANASAAVGLVHRRRALWPAAFSMCFGLAVGWSTPALSNPEGGQAVAGSASIVQSSPSRLDVIQHSERAIIDWRKFSIDPSEHTNFQQPSASAAALNRVTGGDASSILGRLTANGQVFLVNPNGVFFGRGSQVDVAGLVATTADIRNQNFLDGRYVFDQPSDKPNALVVNQGHIEVAENGFAVLAAPHVRNEGLIQARLGQVALAGANTFTLDFEGDGLLTFDVGSDVSRTPSDEDGQPVAALVSNLGTIVANGGTVVLTARAADAVVDHVINMDGVVQAQAVAVRGGEIVLSGGDSGIVEVAGDIDVSGREQGQSGGTVKVLGDKVGLFDGAHIDASGDAGGGEVLIGGNLKGEGPEPNAKHTYVARDANVKADGLSTGDGGKVIVWADEVTGFNGEISARGGSDSGNGGFVEVSGKKDLSFHGRVDLTVVDGDAGTLLLDPENITIVNGGGAPDDGQLDDNQILADDSPGATFIISEQALEALPNADVVLQATNDITIEDLADDELLFAAGPGGSITFTVNRDLGSFNGSFVMDPGDTIRAPGRDVRIFTGISNGANTIGAVDTSSSTAGGEIEIRPGSIIVEGSISIGTLNSSSEFGAGGLISVGTFNLTITNGIDSTGAASSGDILLLGEEIDLPGTLGSVQGTNAQLILRPRSLSRNIAVGGTDNATAALDLTSTDLSALADGFLSIEIGSEDLGGSNGQMTVEGAAFNDPVTLAADILSVDGEIQTNGSSLLVNASNEANVNADITTAGGAISIGGSTIDTTGSVLSSLSTVGQGGEIRLDGVGNVATGDISSSGVLGGGSINISSVQGAVDTTAGSLESFSDGAGGVIALEAAGNIATGLIRSRSFGAASGGSIRLNSGGAIDTTGGVLESSSSSGDGGPIGLTTQGGNISTALVISEAFGETGSGGDITVTVNGTTGSIDTTAGDLRSSSYGGGGAIALTTQGGNISTGIVHSRALDGTGAGGDITVAINGTTGSIDTTAGDLNASSFGGVGGAIALTTQGGNISTGPVFSQGLFGGTGDGGDITLIVDGGGGSIEIIPALSSAAFGGDGGAITLKTQDGNIVADGIVTSSNPDVDGVGGAVIVEANGDIVINNITSSGPSGSGDISVTSSDGAINTSGGALDSSSTNGAGGAIALEAAGDIAAGAIGSTGAAGSGNIVLAGQEIDLLGPTGSVQATNASLSLQPFTSAQDISIGGVGDTNTAALDLTATDLDALADGFASITIGRNDGSGTISIDSAGISLNDPLILQSPATGGIIAANGPMQTTGSLRATAPTIGLRDVTTNDVQTYTGSVTFNSDYVTGGGSFTVDGDSTLASNTTVTTDGGDVLFGALEGPGELTITAGSGDILFRGDVGAQIPLGPVSVASAQNISLTGQFVAGPSEFFYDGSLTSPDPSLEVESLFIDPDATSARLFGSVGGASGREAALAVEGPSGDPDFTINGFVMGSSEPEVLAEPGGLTAAEPNTNTAEEIEVAKQDALIAEEPSEPEPVEEIDYSSVEYQPVLPVRFTPKFSMSDFTMNATIKGGWPFVVDYQLERPGEVRVKISAEGVEPFTFELDGTTTDRQLAEFEVPQRFGAAVKPVSISVIALEEGGTKTVPLQLYGLGAGPKAKGSFAMDPVDFGPPLFIRAQEGETAAYRFKSHSAFDNVIVDFCSVTRTATEHVYRSVHYRSFEQGIKQDDWIGKPEPRHWNGKDTKDEISAGLHKLQVRAWDDGEEWVGAWSGGFISVADDKP